MILALLLFFFFCGTCLKMYFFIKNMFYYQTYLNKLFLWGIIFIFYAIFNNFILLIEKVELTFFV